jgi:tripartite ATP-independent transporter DctP family solute receptor
MKKRTRLVAGLLTLAMVLSLAACGTAGSNSGEAEKTGVEKKKFIIAHVVSEDTCFGAMTDKMKEILEGSGFFDVEVYPAASLVGDSEGVQAVQAGTITLYPSSTGSYSNYASPFFAYDKMFAFDDVRVGRAVANDQELLEVLNSELAQYNIISLGSADMGFRKLTTNKEIKSIDDLSDVKLRVMENPIYVAAWKTLGINPTPVSYTEIYSSLQQGVIEAQENTPELTYATKVYEVQKYIIDTNHLFHNLVLGMNLDYYNNLTDEERAVVQEAAAEGIKACQEATDNAMPKYLELFEKTGCKHISLPDDVLAEMKERVSTTWGEVESRVSPQMWEAYNAAIERAEEAYGIQ